ncbi:hypothetical protein GGS20DRAFT_79103 [Poronia punctata]|nr:hypothetical protein GGS20DRAFT_79103 [Poronia punctata]
MAMEKQHLSALAHARRFMKNLLSRRPGTVLECDVPEGCPICHDPVGIKNPEGITESWIHLYCGHKFGTHCIQRWLEDSIERDPYTIPSCPYCRSEAKHPCGHAVSVPRPIDFTTFSPEYPEYVEYVDYADYPSSRSIGNRYRRLIRQPRSRFRIGQQRPSPYHAQTVGKCLECKALEETEKRMRQRITSGAAQPGSTTTIAIGRRKRERKGSLKSILPQVRLGRANNPPSQPAHDGNRRREEFEWLNLCRIRTLRVDSQLEYTESMERRRRLSF